MSCQRLCLWQRVDGQVEGSSWMDFCLRVVLYGNDWSFLVNPLCLAWGKCRELVESGVMMSSQPSSTSWTCLGTSFASCSGRAAACMINPPPLIQLRSRCIDYEASRFIGGAQHLYARGHWALVPEKRYDSPAGRRRQSAQSYRFHSR